MKNRINLLQPSTSATAGKAAPAGPNRVLVIACLLLCIATVGVYGTLFGLEVQAGKSIQQSQRDIAKQGVVEQEREKMESILSEKRQLTADINRLNSGKPELSAYLDELRAITPVNVIITAVVITDNPFGATIRGITATPLQVAQFGRNMQESVYFKDAIISSGDKRVKDGLYDFTVTVTPVKKGGNIR